MIQSQISSRGEILPETTRVSCRQSKVPPGHPPACALCGKTGAHKTYPARPPKDELRDTFHADSDVHLVGHRTESTALQHHHDHARDFALRLCDCISPVCCSCDLLQEQSVKGGRVEVGARMTEAAFHGWRTETGRHGVRYQSAHDSHRVTVHPYISPPWLVRRCQQHLSNRIPWDSSVMIEGAASEKGC